MVRAKSHHQKWSDKNPADTTISTGYGCSPPETLALLTVLFHQESPWCLKKRIPKRSSRYVLSKPARRPAGQWLISADGLSCGRMAGWSSFPAVQFVCGHTISRPFLHMHDYGQWWLRLLRENMNKKRPGAHHDRRGYRLSPLCSNIL